MKLDQLQNDFIAAIFNTDRESVLDYIASDDRLDASQRLGIYRGSVYGILTQSLGETYPVCKALLGEEFFDKMCDRFIDQYPPSTPFFFHYGDNLSLFLNDFDPVKTLPFIADVAKFEWSRYTLWQKNSIEPSDFSQIASLSEEQQANIVFQLNRTLHLIDSDYRVDLIWFAHQDNSNVSIEEIDVNEKLKLLMWKGGDSIKVINLETEDLNRYDWNFTNSDYWDFLNAISSQSKVTELATHFDEKFPELLNRSIQDGWIESFTCD